MLEKLVEELPRAKCEEAVWSACETYFAGHGFDRLIYIDRPLGRTFMHSNFPTSWLRHYRENGYERIDPFFAFCCATREPMGTGIDFLDDYPFLDGPGRRLIREAGEAGMRAGMSCTVRPAGAGGVGGWNIGSSMSRRDVESIFAERGAVLRLAACFAHERMVALRSRPAERAALSPREEECLRWAAQGLRTKQIAAKTCLKPVTVELYLRNARHKLHAATREQAVAVAILEGHITL